MAQPTQYTRQYNFNDFQTTSPADPLPGVQVDNELNSAKTNLDGLNANIAKIQRDDGLLANQSVHKNSLDTDVLALIGLSGYTVAGNWSASNAYTAGTLVNFNDATYLAVTAHTSGTVFATDKDAGKWILLANAAINTSASTVDKFEGTGSQTAFTLTYTYTSNTDVLVFVNGALRNPGDDYTISGNTITFSTAPSTPSVSGNENVIIWGPNVTVQSAVTAAQTASSNSSGFATAASNSAAAALVSQNSATASASTATTQAGTATTQAGIATAKAVLTAADAVSTAADVVSTNADAASTAADVVTTNADAATTTADRAQVNTDKGIVAADKAIVAADKALVAADKVDADNSRIAAQAAQAAAEAALDTFDDRFLGAKASDPTLDNDGNALQDGALFYDTANELMKVYDQTNTVWRQLSLTGTNQTNVNAVAGQISPTNNISTVAGAVANIATVAADLSGSNNTGLVGGSIANVNLTGGSIANVNTVAASIADVNNFADTYFVGTSAPSSPTVGDLWFDSNPGVLVMKVYNGSGFVNAGSAVNGIAQSESYIVGTSSGSYAGSTTVFPATYDSGFVEVYLNGVKLHGNDFTATNGSTVTLASAAVTGDTLEIVSYGTFTLANIAANQLTDVHTTGVADGQILQYSSANTRFEPVTFQGGAGYFVGENGTTGNTSTGLGDIFRVHEAALDTATTIPASTNALAAGPLTLNAALTVNGTVTVV